MTVVAVSEVSICSEALNYLGDDAILDITENTPRARLCNRMFWPTRDEVLQEMKPSFARRRVKLTLSSASPNHEYANAHLLPADYLAMFSTDIPKRIHQGSKKPWTVEDGKLLSDESTVNIVYVYRNVNPQSWSQLFNEALKWKMAWKLAHPITGLTSKANEARENYDDALEKASSLDGAEDPSEVFDYDGLVTVRLG